jgi:uncharacterized protein YkwD
VKKLSFLMIVIIGIITFGCEAENSDNLDDNESNSTTSYYFDTDSDTTIETDSDDINSNINENNNDESGSLDVNLAPVITEIVFSELDNNEFLLTATVEDDKDLVSDLTILWQIVEGDFTFEKYEVVDNKIIASFSNYESSGIVNLIVADTENQEINFRYIIQAPNTNIISINKEDLENMDEQKQALTLINYYRENSGLNALNLNELLDNSALGHANYLSENQILGHVQTEGYTAFTGETASDRAVNSSYSSRMVSENLSTGSTAIDSVNELMSAIYHRIGFLSFDIDEIGIGYKTYDSNFNVYVYNMANSNISNLCNQDEFSGYGTYNYGICADFDFKIDNNLYIEAKNILQKNNTEVVTFPFNGQIDFQPIFNDNETPDPTPNLNISGNPISIQFNPAFYDENSIEIQSFELKNKDSDTILETWELNKVIDINAKFSSLEFAFFPIEKLEWNTNYKATFRYTTSNNEAITKVILFKTAESE